MHSQLFESMMQSTFEMWTWFYSILRCIFWTFFLWTISIPVSTAQSPKNPSDADWNFRHELFQILLQQQGMHGTDSLNDAIFSPNQSAIIVIGKGDALSAQGALIKGYIHSGGRMLIAVDALECPGVANIEPGPVFAESLSDTFQDFSDCLLIRNLSNSEPLTESLDTLVTNRTGWIDQRYSDMHWQELLTLPQKTLPFDSRSKPIGLLGKTSLATSDGDTASGGLILLADPSILSNGMMWYHDNGHFAARIAKWLAEGNRKTYALIIDDAAQSDYPIEALMSQNGQSSMPTPPEPLPTPELDSLLKVANAAIKELADAEQINRQLQNHSRRIPTWRYIWLVWIGLAAVLGFFLLRFLLKRSTEYLPRVLDRRSHTARELLHQSLSLDLQNKLAAESLAREFSKRWTGKESEADWRIALEELKDAPQSGIPNEDRVQVEVILATAVFGGRTSMENGDLENLGFWIQRLLTVYRSPMKAAAANT